MSPTKLQSDRIAWARILALLTTGGAGAFAIMVASVSAERLTVEQEDSGATLSILGTSPTEAELGGDDPGTVGFQLGLGTTRDAVRASGLSCSINESYYGTENGIQCNAEGPITMASESNLSLQLTADTGYGTALSIGNASFYGSMTAASTSRSASSE